MQTGTYDTQPSPKTAGLIDYMDAVVTRPKINESASDIAPGACLRRGTDAEVEAIENIIAFTTPHVQFAGIAVFGKSTEIKIATPTSGVVFPPNSRFTAVTNGPANVTLDGTAVAGQPVFQTLATGEYTGVDGTALTTLIPARFEESGVAGDVVTIYVSLQVA